MVKSPYDSTARRDSRYADNNRVQEARLGTKPTDPVMYIYDAQRFSLLAAK